MGTLPFVSADEIHNPVQTKVKSDLKRGFRSIEVRCKANLPMMCHLSDKKYRFPDNLPRYQALSANRLSQII
jgi:hypothetical protein